MLPPPSVAFSEYPKVNRFQGVGESYARCSQTRFSFSFLQLFFYALFFFFCPFLFFFALFSLPGGHPRPPQPAWSVPGCPNYRTGLWAPDHHHHHWHTVTMMVAITNMKMVITTTGADTTTHWWYHHPVCKWWYHHRPRGGGGVL